MKEISITKNKVALVDDADFPSVSCHRWHQKKSKNITYARALFNGHRVSMHRFILIVPKNLVVDHINGNGLDNRRSNLRICTQSQNMMNQKRHHDSKSSYKGIWFSRDTKKWGVRIKAYGKRHYAGLFGTAVEAAKVYDFLASQFFGSYANLNFPSSFRLAARGRGFFSNPTPEDSNDKRRA